MNKCHRLIIFSLLFCTSFCTCFFNLVPAYGEILVPSKVVSQGDTLEVSLTSEAVDAGALGESAGHDEPSAVKFNGQSYKLFPRSEKMHAPGSAEKVALLAIPADLDPGVYPIACGAQSLKITVKDGHFPLQHITLSASKDNFDMSKGEKEAVEGAKATVSDERLWDGKFSPPSKAPVSALFGIKRTANGRLLKDYFHSGLDYRASLGSPIMATAGGKVLLVGRGFKLHGNTVAIDHGQGVVSFYIHMQSIKVKQGETVARGQTIGTVGQTGRATGPHLHFSIYVNQVAANPRNWYQNEF